MKLIPLATLAAALIATSAFAGEPDPKDTSLPSNGGATVTTSASTSTSTPAVDANVNAASSASTFGTPTGATVTVSTVTNGPVADTPENRAKYRPLSRAGNRTQARGN